MKLNLKTILIILGIIILIASLIYLFNSDVTQTMFNPGLSASPGSGGSA